ncbi:hypothetical protein L083_6567 [Actinoplanes sp. N902-109]|nr:hypothetical protein L083_6567 [Actinoplanes sp. N902-109]
MGSQQWQRIGIDGPWPWTTVLPQTAVITVESAWSGWVDSLAVKAGKLTWSAPSLSRMTGKPDGAGVFASIRLPHPLPPLAVHLRAESAGKTFDDRFDSKGDAAPELIGEVLRIVHVDNTVPPWTITGEELYAFAAVNEPIRPRHIQDLAQRAAWVAQLLLIEHNRTPA